MLKFNVDVFDAKKLSSIGEFQVSVPVEAISSNEAVMKLQEAIGALLKLKSEG